MVSKKMRIISIVLGVIMLWLGFFGLIWCGKKIWQRQGVKRIESGIGISLPKDAKVKYHYFDMSYDGSYTQFTVLKFQESPDVFISNYPLVQVDESSVYDDFVHSVKGRNIKEKHIPSFDELLMSNKTKFISGHGFTTLYFPSTLELVFFIVHVD